MKWNGLAIATIGVAMLAGCGDSESTPDDSGKSSSNSSEAPAKAVAGTITGKVLGEDGKPIAVAEDITVTITGISQAGERISYSPPVKPDGTYQQKVVPGSYRVDQAQVKVKFNGAMFRFDLVPQGKFVGKNRDSGEPITQDFVWKVTGQRAEGQADPNNHTHWHGMSIGARYTGWRDDIGKAPPKPPKGTMFIFKFTPISKCVDGRDLQAFTVEREYNTDDLVTPNNDLNDIPPASYEITCTAKLPDGSTKPVVLQGKGDYPKYHPATKATLENDNITGGIFKMLMTFAME